MKDWTKQRRISFAVHVFFVSVPFLASSTSALLLWRTLFKSWWLAVPAVLVIDVLALAGLVLTIAKIPSPFVPLRKALPFISAVPLGWELYLLLKHNALWITVPVVALAVTVLTVIAWKCFDTIEALFIDPVIAARERAREQLENVTVQLASLTEANAVVSDFVTAWQRQQVHVTVMDERPQLAAESKTARVRALAQELGKSESTVWRLIRSGELTLEEPS